LNSIHTCLHIIKSRLSAVTGASTAGNVTTLYLDGVSTSSGIGGSSRNNLVGAIGNGSAGGKLAVVKNGTGLWTLSAASTYTGGLFVNAGTIRYFGPGTQFGGAGNIITIGTNVTFSHANSSLITNAQLLIVNGNFLLTGSANTLWTGAMDLGAAVRVVTAASTNNTFSGVISNGGITKAGAGELILSGSNTYGGGTTVSEGKLVGSANGALGASNVTVAGGATLTLNATNCINNKATLTLATNSTLNLNFIGADTVGGISRDSGATWLPFGTYNATALGATGPGSLTITSSSFLLIIK
jgi:autotransporter-associated beta strand protein